MIKSPKQTAAAAADRSFGVNHDYCYPGVLIVGQVLEVLEEKSYPADQIAFMEPQAGGACLSLTQPFPLR